MYKSLPLCDLTFHDKKNIVLHLEYYKNYVEAEFYIIFIQCQI